MKNNTQYLLIANDLSDHFLKQDPWPLKYPLYFDVYPGLNKIRFNSLLKSLGLCVKIKRSNGEKYIVERKSSDIKS